MTCLEMQSCKEAESVANGTPSPKHDYSLRSGNADRDWHSEQCSVQRGGRIGSRPHHNSGVQASRVDHPSHRHNAKMVHSNIEPGKRSSEEQIDFSNALRQLAGEQEIDALGAGRAEAFCSLGGSRDVSPGLPDNVTLAARHLGVKHVSMGSVRMGVGGRHCDLRICQVRC